jgi:flagella basal body P-ring formation protein FlgA
MQRRKLIAVVTLTLVFASALTAAQQAPELTAADAIRAAVLERLGPDVEVTVTILSLPAEPKVFQRATPDPAATLGRPIRFSLSAGAGRTVSATAEIRVTAEYAMTTHSIGRGQVLTADDVSPAKGELRAVPLRRLPTAAALVGAKTLRPIEIGVPIQSSFVAMKRIVEPGDKVTVVAAAGAIEVTATLVAADGGHVGDVIRVVNPETKRYLRGRILRAGIVEVVHGR